MSRHLTGDGRVASQRSGGVKSVRGPSRKLETRRNCKAMGGFRAAALKNEGYF